MLHFKGTLGIDVKEPITKRVNQLQIHSDKHKIYIVNRNKKALCWFDDKRYICDDGITTYPFGIETIAEELGIKL
jgi:predicted RNA-binding protein Jag